MGDPSPSTVAVSPAAPAVGEVVPGGPPGRSPRPGTEIGERIRARVESHLEVVERNAHRLFDRSLTAEELAAATTASRGLAVLLGRIELPTVARLARDLVELFSGAGPGDAPTAVLVAATCDDLRALVDSAIAQQAALAVRNESLAVIGPASETVDGLCWVAGNRGYRVVTADGSLPSDALLPPDGPDPAAVIVVGGSSSADDALLLAVRERWAAPVVALHADAEAATIRRLAEGAGTVLPLDRPADEIVDEVTRAIAAGRLAPVAVLCGLGGDLGPVTRLVAHGFTVLEVRRVDDLPDAVERHGGSVVLGPGLTSDEVATAVATIRALPALRPAPILWLGGRRDRHWVDRHDVVTAAELDDGVAIRLAGRLRRRAAEVAEVGGVTGGILGWDAAQILIDRELVAAHRYGRFVALGSVRLDRLVPAGRVAALTEVLGGEFRRNDILGLRAERELVVALEGVPREVAVSRLGSVMSRLDLGTGEVRVGVALFPSDGRSAVELVASADAAADLSADNGGPPVVATTWRPDSEVVDAIVADADPVLSGLVADLVAGTGLRTRICATGPEILAALTAEGPGSIPRLLLLDLDVSGVDGFWLLRELRTAGLLPQVKVMLMMARFSEVDLRMALDIGAADVIRKPFSGTLLLHRVRNLLGEGS